MKILVVNGGPHKGNTWLLTEKVKQLLLEFDKTILFREIQLSDRNLPFCTGCSNCFRNGHRTCPHAESIQPVMDLMEDSDAVIFSVPCFQGHLPGIMKNFTDHMAFLLHRPRYFTKKALIITTTGGVSAGGTAKELATALAGWGFNHCYRLPVRTFSWNAYRPSVRDLKKTYDITWRFYCDTKSGEMHVPGFGVLIPFNLFRAMCGGSRGGNKYPTEDHKFWPKYRGMRYAPGIPLTPAKKLFGQLVYLVGKILSKSMVVTYKK